MYSSGNDVSGATMDWRGFPIVYGRGYVMYLFAPGPLAKLLCGNSDTSLIVDRKQAEYAVRYKSARVGARWHET